MKLNWLRRLILAAAVFGVGAPAFAQTPTTPKVAPAGYALVSIAGMPSVIPTLDTAMRNDLDAAEHVSILALVSEGQGTPALVVSALVSVGSAFCAEAQGMAPGCTTFAATMAPYVAEATLVFALVPASQWDPTTFSINMPVYAAAFVTPPAPPPPPPPGKNLIGQCYPAGAPVICGPGPGANLTNIADGQLVTERGKNYVARISSGLGMPQASLTFIPVKP